MTQKKMNLCYFCGRPAISKEHVPPKMMFRGLDCDSMTVPACSRHNTQRSEADQTIVSGFLKALASGKGRYPLKPIATQAINNAQRSLSETHRTVISAPLLSDPPGSLPNVTYIKEDIRSWLRQVTAALVYYGTQVFDPTIRWAKAKTWSPNWVDAKTQSPL